MAAANTANDAQTSLLASFNAAGPSIILTPINPKANATSFVFVSFSETNMLLAITTLHNGVVAFNIEANEAEILSCPTQSSKKAPHYSNRLTPITGTTYVQS